MRKAKTFEQTKRALCESYGPQTGNFNFASFR